MLLEKTLAIFCASKASLWRKGKRIGDNVEIILNDDSFSVIDIHNNEDLRLANAAMKIRNS